MRVIKIDPVAKTVTEAEMPEDRDAQLKYLQEAVGGYIEEIDRREYPDGSWDAVYVDEEALLKATKGRGSFIWVYFGKRRWEMDGNTMIIGPAVIAGVESIDGDTVPCRVSVEDVTANILWMEQ